jgi:hypothetical protein
MIVIVTHVKDRLDIESLALFGCFRGLKQPLFGIFRGLILLRAFLEFSGALN